jgi:hypothetical protein
MYAVDEALVVDVQGGDNLEVLIRYIAWDHSFDEWVPRNSPRLAERGTRLLAHMAATDVQGALRGILGTQGVAWLQCARPLQAAGCSLSTQLQAIG